MKADTPVSCPYTEDKKIYLPWSKERRNGPGRKTGQTNVIIPNQILD